MFYHGISYQPTDGQQVRLPRTSKCITLIFGILYSNSQYLKIRCYRLSKLSITVKLFILQDKTQNILRMLSAILLNCTVGMRINSILLY
jgi:hypothetical protein